MQFWMQFVGNHVSLGLDYPLRDGCFSIFCLLSCVVDLLVAMLCVWLVVVGCGCFKKWGYGLCFVGMGMSIPVTNR